MDLLEKFDKLNNRLINLLDENKELKQQNKNIQEINQELKKNLNNIQEENKELKDQLDQLQNTLNSTKQQNEQLEIISKQNNIQVEIISQENKEFKQKYENLQEENNVLKEKIKQKNEQVEIISQNLEKTLRISGLDELKLDEVNDDDDDDLQSIEPSELSKSEYSKSSEYIWGSFNESWEGIRVIRVIVGLYFGAKYSGFSYCHVCSKDIITTNDKWPRVVGTTKTNTALRYDSDWNVIQWGYQALCKRSGRNKSRNVTVEFLNLKSQLPDGLNHEKAITDYLREIGQVIKETIVSHWMPIDFFGDILLILTIPAEYTSEDMAIMRKCAYNANLIRDKYSRNLQFIPEPEAVAIYCVENLLREYDSMTIGTTFMIVNCGDDTVKLTSYKLIENKKLSEIIEYEVFCGSTYIDREFVNFLGRKIGTSAVDLFKKNYYRNFQYMIQEFCRFAKSPFTGDDKEFFYELDITENAPNLSKYVSEETKETMEENDWIIEIKYDDIKSMFDPVVNRIIRLIHLQLSRIQETCSTIHLVGDLSKYLQYRIRQEFPAMNTFIAVDPSVVISRGAVECGGSLENGNDVHATLYSIVLKYTYGVKVRNYWNVEDPADSNGRIDGFECFVKRGTEVKINECLTKPFMALSLNQTKVSFKIYYTLESDAKYCDEPGMNLLGKLTVDLPGSSLDKLLLGINFGQMKITVIVKNETNGEHFKTTFDIDEC